MRILITGATGFVGGHLAEALLAGGDEIHGVDRSVRLAGESAAPVRPGGFTYRGPDRSAARRVAAPHDRPGADLSPGGLCRGGQVVFGARGRLGRQRDGFRGYLRSRHRRGNSAPNSRGLIGPDRTRRRTRRTGLWMNRRRSGRRIRMPKARKRPKSLRCDSPGIRASTSSWSGRSTSWARGNRRSSRSAPSRSNWPGPNGDRRRL